MTARPTIEALNVELAARLEDWLPAIVGGAIAGTGRRTWYAGRTREGWPGDSLHVATAGPRRGAWYWHARGIGGDPLGLIALIKFNGDMRAAWRWAAEYVGGAVAVETPAERARREARARAQAEALAASAAARQHTARKIFFYECTKSIDGTPARAYLEGRGISFDRLGRFPGALRFHPRLPHPHSGRPHPAMVAAVSDNDGRVQAVHRTYLVQRDGRWDRLRLDRDGVDGKLGLGAWAGGAVKLWRGERVDPITGEIKPDVPWRDAPPRSALALVEGIENGLSVAMLRPELRVLACLSAANVVTLRLPAVFATVHLWVDGDGRSHEEAWIPWFHIQEDLIAEGRAVEAHRPALGFKDWNEFLVRGAQSKPVPLCRPESVDDGREQNRRAASAGA